MKDLLINTTGLKEVSINTTTEARAQRDALLQLTKKIASVSTADEANQAVITMRDAKALLSLIEANRVAAKAPVLEIGKQIDGLAKELTLQLEAETSRLSRVLGVYTEAQNRKAEEARQAAWREEQRIKEEAAAREREAFEKAQAEQAELLRKQEVARTDEKRAQYAREAEAKALRDHQAADRRQLEQEQAIVATRTAAVLVAPKVQGVATRKEVRFDVQDVVALYEAAPYLVTLVPNVAAIKSALKGLQGEQTLPGVRHWIDAVAVTR